MPRSDLLAVAQASEIDWKHAAPVIKGYRPGQGEFVYFISESDDGPIKIGRAQHPIKRLRELQTGNPRRLRIERLIFGGADVERLLHQYWRHYAIGGSVRRSVVNPQYKLETEWFRADGREAIFTAADAILERQRTSDPDESFVASVGAAMTQLGYELVVGETIAYLASRVEEGYVQAKLRPVA